MAKYTAQLQPDYHRDTHKILISFKTDASLMVDLINALKPLGTVEIIHGSELSTQEFDFYLTSNSGNFGLILGDVRINQDPNSVYLIQHSLDAQIFRCKSVLGDDIKFDVLENLEHPFYEPLNLWGQSALAVSFFIMGLISVFGKPDFEADISGLPLGLLAALGSAVIILKFGAISFFLRRIGEKFPGPVNLNTLAFSHMIAMTFILLLFL